MATELKLRRDVEADIDAMTPAEGEPIYDITNKRLRVGDASTSGGILLGSAKDLQDQPFSYGTVTGTDTLTITFSPAPADHTAGLLFWIKIANNNTGAVTFNPNTIGAKTVKKNAGADDLVADDFVAGGVYPIQYDGINYQVLGSISTGLSAPDFTSSEQTVTDNTQLDVAHGLGAIPTLVHVILRCKTATSGFNVGDEVVAYIVGGVADDRGQLIFVDSTNVSIVSGSGGVLVVTPSSKAVQSLNNLTGGVGYWRWIVRAWT